MKKIIGILLAGSLMGLLLAGCGTPTYSTIEEYIGADESVKSEIDATAEEYGMDIIVDGNTITYEYDLGMVISEDMIDVAATQIEEGIDLSEDSYILIKEQLQSETGIEEVTLVIRYVDADGKVIYTKTY